MPSTWVGTTQWGSAARLLRSAAAGRPVATVGERALPGTPGQCPACLPRKLPGDPPAAHLLHRVWQPAVEDCQLVPQGRHQGDLQAGGQRRQARGGGKACGMRACRAASPQYSRRQSPSFSTQAVKAAAVLLTSCGVSVPRRGSKPRQ